MRARTRATAFAAAYGAAALLATGSAALADRAPEIGQPAPQFVAPLLDGHELDLSAQRGKVVIVNFWASWCGPCRAEMPLLDSFYQRYRGRGLVLVGVSVDDRHDKKEVLRIMQQFSYPAALAVEAKVNGFGPPLAVPMTWIIDPAGVLRARLLAASGVTEKSLNELVVPLLAGEARGGR
jgi:cytochrome c biogenesis protein CcmG/thiol:disulfide interchange protein DsbE